MASTREWVEVLKPQVTEIDQWDALHDPLSFIQQLSAVAAPTGNEDRLTDAVARYTAQHGWSCEVDRLGQVLVSKGPKDADLDVMLVAHLDELGLVVRAIEPEGWLRVHRLGGIPERVLPGLGVVVHTQAGDLDAVIGTKSHHLTRDAEKYMASPAAELYLDLGLSSDVEVRAAGVRVGDPVTYAPVWRQFGDGRFSGKSLDNRVGVASLMRVLHALEEEAPASRVHVVFSCLEEFNLQGPLTAAKRLRPDVALVVDIVPATDTPDLVGDGVTHLGGGPSLSRLAFHGRGTLGGLVPHPALVRALEDSAQHTGTDIQYDAVIGCLNDSAYLPMSTEQGVATVSLNIPCRYTHSPVEMSQLSDVLDSTTVITDFVRRAHELDLSRGASQIYRGMA